MSSFKQLYKQEKLKADEKRAAYREEQGYNDFVKWPQGVTRFTLHDQIPRDFESFGKPVKVFTITVDGEVFDWTVNPLSPMYLELLEQAAKGQWELSINRMGEGLQTRYDLIIPS